ncbi:MAG: fatty acid--CoA ligase, partial [Candidatus Methanomethylicaceae archaeon]
VDDLGYLYFKGRIKDMIKTGGLNVYPQEVESVILQHPAVQEVAVIGVPHEKWGEAVMAVVVRKPEISVTSQELISFCEARLAGYKKPRLVEFVEELPKDSFGSKVKKEILRAMFRKTDH